MSASTTQTTTVSMTRELARPLRAAHKACVTRTHAQRIRCVTAAEVLRAIDDPDNEMFGRLANHWHVKKPLIGALQGSAVGGGLEVAIMCDVIVMADDAYIADLHAKINVGGMNSMNTFLPPMIARELTMTDKRINAQDCLDHGFANYVLPKDQILDKAIDLAKATALMGPDSIQRLKQGSVELQRASGNLRYENYYELSLIHI